MFKPDFQDGGHGSYFGFCIRTIFIIFIYVALIFPTKFLVNWPLCSEEIVQNRLLRWQRWRPSCISDQNNFSKFLINKLCRYFLPSFEPIGISVQKKNFKIDFQDGGHLGFPTGTNFSYFFIYKSWYFLASFESVDLSVQEKNFKIDFQDGRHGSHYRLPIRTISAISDLQVNALILPTKFQVNWPFGSRKEIQHRFSRWRQWWPSWILDLNDFSSF